MKCSVTFTFIVQIEICTPLKVLVVIICSIWEQQIGAQLGVLFGYAKLLYFPSISIYPCVYSTVYLLIHPSIHSFIHSFIPLFTLLIAINSCLHCFLPSIHLIVYPFSQSIVRSISQTFGQSVCTACPQLVK